MDYLNPSHFDKVCRACLVPATSKALQMHDLSLEYIENLFGDRDSSIVLYHHELPQQICSGCYKKCEKWLAFRMLFEDNHKILKNIVESSPKATIGYTIEELEEEVDEKDLKNDEDVEVLVQQSNDPTEEFTISVVGIAEGEEEAVLEYEEEPEAGDDNTNDHQSETETTPIKKGKTKRKSRVNPHLNLESSEVPDVFPLLYIECSICDKEIDNCEDYQKHLLKEHMKDRTLVCTLCKASNSSKDAFIKHNYTHTKIRFRCPLKCTTKLSSRVSVTTHLKVVHKINYSLKFRQCFVCGVLTDSDLLMKAHLLEHVGECSAESQKYDCFMCGNSFETDRQLASHLYSHAYALHARYCCDACGKIVNSREFLRMHMMTHIEEKLHKCETCGKSYKNDIYLRHHMLRHKLERTIKCTECEKLFYTSRDMKAHVKTHGPNNKSYVCQYCERGFFNMSVLKEHVKIRHTGEREFPCDQCDRSYFRRRELVEHQRSHTGEKPFSCEVCHRIYARKTTLLTHMKTHNAGYVDKRNSRRAAE